MGNLMKINFQVSDMLRKALLFLSYVCFMVSGRMLSRRDLQGILSTTERPLNDLYSSLDLIQNFDFISAISPDQDYESEEPTTFLPVSDNGSEDRDPVPETTVKPESEVSDVGQNDDTNQNEIDDAAPSLKYATLVTPSNILVEPQLELCLNRFSYFGKVEYI